MPTYITIEATDKIVQVKFNDLQDLPDVNAYDADFKRSGIMQVFHFKSPEFVTVTMWNETEWQLNLNGADGGHPVSWIDLNDGNGQQVPTTMEELHNLVKQLII